ncbi:SAM-dependent methyltransferase [Rhodopila sp.]|uniref:SAM-dependent methyltransferase n=1 Tax=Rhodopila sp. TaxID=2480087 RepID=UPI003D09EAE6
MTTDQDVALHYRHGTLLQTLLAAATAMGKDPARLQPADLMGADEFHLGGVRATRDLAAQLGLTPEMHLLDIGSGLGGPARQLAAMSGCRVTGIDLSEEFVDLAVDLTDRMGLADRVAFRQGGATALPFPAASFDRATLLHVGMNIADKRGLTQSVHRLLRPGALFAIYDVMRCGLGALDFPLPWASGPDTSFVEPAEAYREALTEAGFTIIAERNRARFALESLAAARDGRGSSGPPSAGSASLRPAPSGPPPLGPGIAMGASAGRKIANLTSLLERGVVAPVEMIAKSAD